MQTAAFVPPDISERGHRGSSLQGDLALERQLAEPRPVPVAHARSVDVFRLIVMNAVTALGAGSMQLYLFGRQR